MGHSDPNASILRTSAHLVHMVGKATMSIIVTVKYKVDTRDKSTKTWKSIPIGTDNRKKAILRAGADYFHHVPNSQILAIRTYKTGE